MPNKEILTSIKSAFWQINDWCLAHLDEDLSQQEDAQRKLLDAYVSIAIICIRTCFIEDEAVECARDMMHMQAVVSKF